jgi:hypothetical protein
MLISKKRISDYYYSSMEKLLYNTKETYEEEERGKVEKGEEKQYAFPQKKHKKMDKINNVFPDNFPFTRE